MEKINIESRRSNCPLSTWLEIFGDKWTMIILRDMVSFNKSNFKEFTNSNENIATNILADRLKKLVNYGLIEKKLDTKNRTSYNYSITQRGKDLTPIFKDINKWSKKHIFDVKDESS